MHEGGEGHVILCQECGMAALVPFKPREGRRVLCPPCHRIRKRDEMTPGRPRLRPDRRALVPPYARFTR